MSLHRCPSGGGTDAGTGGLHDDSSTGQARCLSPRRGRRGSLLDPYRAVIDGLLAEGVWNAVVIWRELQARGYPGEISIIRDYLRPKRALRPGARATVRFETEPGRQLQTDWAVQATGIAGQPVTVHIAVSTLSYSRRFHFWATD